jgi:acyl dehydratase
MSESGASTVLCGGCRNCGRCRLGVGEFTLDGLTLSAPVMCREAFHAGPRVAHGGWTAATFDDVLGRFLTQRGVRSVTKSLTVDFLKPVPVEEPLLVEAVIAGHEGRHWNLTATLRLAGGDTPLAAARGIWSERRDDHFVRHESAMEAYREIRRPPSG